MSTIKGSTILVLGGAGQVGFEICKQLLRENPTKIVLADLTKKKVERGIRELKNINEKTILTGEWGNIFVRTELKEKINGEIIKNPESQEKLIQDVFGEFNDETVKNSFLFQIMEKHNPKIVIDAINTATALAYLDPYAQVMHENDSKKWLRIALSMSIPHLVRHTQILFHSLRKVKTEQYLKIGTSGSGGLGFTLPFNHGEREVPSRLLMGKTAVAGAQTMLLWVLGRTPGAPVIKEIKVTALIGWRNIGSGKIRTKDGEIELYDCPIEKAQPIGKGLQGMNAVRLGRYLEGPWIDTGENDVFTKEMFAAITAADGMELITPEEIAEEVIREVKGEDTGKEIIRALDSASLGPTLKGTAKRKIALERLERLDSNEVASIQTLGPLTAKILWEATILKKIMREVPTRPKEKPGEIEKKALEIISSNKELRAKIISIGIPILLPNGKILTGPNIMVPATKKKYATIKEIEKWANVGWVDLRSRNWKKWLTWLTKYSEAQGGGKPMEFKIGDVCGWVFAHELGGLRIKR
ncbi:MAG: hypothetical protein QXR53_04345 [Candidatus Norongarragalinales archaeon]